MEKESVLYLNMEKTLAIVSKEWVKKEDEDLGEGILLYFLGLFIYLLAALGLCCCLQAFSSGEQGLLFVALHRLLIAVASPAVEQGLQGVRASVVVAHGFSWFAAYGIFLDQGSNTALAGGFFNTEPPGKPYIDF